jgi:two-component system response regulator HydG
MATAAPRRILAVLPRASRPAGALEAVLPAGTEVRWAGSVAQGLAGLSDGPWSVTLLSLGPEGAEPDLVRRVAADPRAGLVVLTTPTPSIELTLSVEAWGVAALLPEPVGPEELAAVVTPFLVERRGIALPDVPDGDGEVLVTSSRAMAGVIEMVARVAATSATVLITGESGTGKEVVARMLHGASARREGPFVAVNCAAIPEHLLEAELFGHEQGAFTGAVARREGRFGRAHGGTLFLDEIGDMGLPLQAKILRALEEGEIERLGSTGTVRVDVRIVAATHHALEARVAAGTFREDLYFRLAVVRVEIPPLRERPGDLRALALHFGAAFARRYGRAARYLSEAALDRLEEHGWPGNVRELRNVMDRAVLLARGDTIRSTDLRMGLASPRGSPAGGAVAGTGGDSAPWPPTLSLREVEGLHIAQVLRHTGGHMGEAARILGIHRNTMTAKVREHGLDAERLGRRP